MVDFINAMSFWFKLYNIVQFLYDGARKKKVALVLNLQLNWLSLYIENIFS